MACVILDLPRCELPADYRYAQWRVPGGKECEVTFLARADRPPHIHFRAYFGPVVYQAVVWLGEPEDGPYNWGASFTSENLPHNRLLDAAKYALSLVLDAGI